MTKKVKKPNHLMGKHSGYEFIGGVYHIAPMYTDNFGKLADRSAGVDQLVKSVARHVAEINKEIASEQRDLWLRLTEDLGLDKNKSYYYQSYDGTIHEVEKKAKK